MHFFQALDEFEGKELVNTSPLYFSRTRGLFRECFPGEKSEDPEKTAAPLGKSNFTFKVIKYRVVCTLGWGPG